MSRRLAMAERRSLEIFKIAFWPCLALIIVVLVFVTGGMGSAKSVELGPLKISFAEDLLGKVGEPTEEVGTALAKMNPLDMEILISHGEGTGSPICTVGNLRTDLPFPVPKSERDKFDSYARLAALGLIDVRDAAPDYDSTWCKPGGQRFAWLSDSGVRTRRYLVDLVTQSLVIKKA